MSTGDENGAPQFTPDQKAAHIFLTELRTRISTQPLPYQHGVEKRALESLYEVFGQAREAIKDHPGCEEFAEEVTKMLNLTLRPVTAKWHRLSEGGILDSRDGADSFREDLAGVQKDLREFAGHLHEIAYNKVKLDELTPPPMTEDDVDKLFDTPLNYGIPEGDMIELGKLASKKVEVLESKDDSTGEGVSVELEVETKSEGEKKVRTSFVGVENINTLERGEVEKRRNSKEGEDAIGLALSGGGIRSATFCLGVTQVLADKKLLGDVDFLSTVSGGGYAGSFLSQQLSEAGDLAGVASPHGPDPKPVRYLRQRAKYLTARSLWNAWSKVTATVAGMLMNWTVPLLVLVGLALLTTFAKDLFHGESLARIGAAVLGGFGLLSGLVYFYCLRKGSEKSKLTGSILAGGILACLLGACAWGLSGLFGFVFGEGEGVVGEWKSFGDLNAALANSRVWDGLGALWMGIGALASLVPAVLRFVPVFQTAWVRMGLMKVALFAAGTFLPALGIAIYLTLCAVGRVEGGGVWALVIAAVCLLALAIFLININLTGPHRLYRNSLSKTFVERDDATDTDFPLKETNPDGHAPYHLINATVNLPTSHSPGLRDRGCDFFLFSKHYIGSPSVGYRPTDEWNMNGDRPDLASAMAISGAAFSSSMGLGSIRPLRALLTFLNIRLGFWIRRPHIGRVWKFPVWKHPGFKCLLREMTGTFMDEGKRWVNVSDGGHIENLAIYELLRRRCKFIVCVDGEADPKYTFHGLMTLVRHAQLDFGVTINPDLTEIRPEAKSGLSRCHYHLCRIKYPEGTGLLLYLKLSVTGNETELIKRYRTNHPEFPHQTTLDQFFDQEQFEAYRQLGVHVAEGLFASCLMGDKQAPDSIREWFKRLSANLLLPD